jgi:hypothetical protein
MDIDMQMRNTQEEIDDDFDRISSNLEKQGFKYWFTECHVTHYKHVETGEHATITMP